MLLCKDKWTTENSKLRIRESLFYILNIILHSLFNNNLYNGEIIKKTYKNDIKC